jgi:epoxyqueuosine reductase
MTSLDLLSQSRSNSVKKLANDLGFLDCRISKAEPLQKEARQLEGWLSKGFQGNMDYLENNFDKRVDPTKLVPGAKSVIVLSENYYSEAEQNPDSPKISKYAYGRDYHKVIRKKMKHFLALLNAQFGEIQGRGFVDSAPVLEKAWAAKSGLGWIGKHSNVLTKKNGSFFFLAVLVVDLELAPDSPTTNHCGACTACIDACPTEAIVDSYVVDGSKCISYYTIELKDDKLPDLFKGRFNDWMFGCDICQDVCPWNRFSKQHQEPQFSPKDELLIMDRKAWENIELETFESLFSGSAVKRTGYQGLKRNIQFLAIDSVSKADER